LDDVRSPEILALPRDAVTAVTVTHPDGTTTRLARDKTDWTLEQNGESVGFEVDDTRVQSALKASSTLNATGFFDPGETETDALPKPDYEVHIEAGSDSHTLGVGQTKDGEQAFVAFPDKPYHYKIRNSAFDALTADATYFRAQPEDPRQEER
ncbi:MAG: DUF4340 domain-containing protein, partial [Myxococcota bacterium]